jgi:hypothetical protein
VNTFRLIEDQAMTTASLNATGFRGLPAHAARATVALLAGWTLWVCPALAFDSGSTGADGDFAPTVNTEVPLPPSGILNFNSINIPANVRVTFKKNATNTPVVLLVKGSATIAGIIDLNASSAPDSGTAGDGNLGDDGLPGLGGPGGYDGGQASVLLASGAERGSNGLGPGGGNAGQPITNVCICGGGGAGHSSAGTGEPLGRIAGGPAYGSDALLPLIGGSGGGGGASSSAYRGSGGGGGGGAILIAASGTINVSGQILANGGNSGRASGTSSQNTGSTGGAGSGGSIRLVATTITGNGTIQARGGTQGDNGSNGSYRGGPGAAGRIRLEADTIQRTTAGDPWFRAGTPSALFLPNLPRLRITRVAGSATPDAPTGRADLLLPGTIGNPVTVEFETAGIPPAGNRVRLTLTPANAAAVVTDSSELSGTEALAVASASVTLPSGPSVLLATITYQVSLALGESLSRFAGNERVERVRLSGGHAPVQAVTLITVSGKEYDVPLAALASGG